MNQGKNIYRTSPGAALPRPRPNCARCRGPIGPDGQCARRCHLQGRAVRQDAQHPADGGAE